MSPKLQSFFLQEKDYHKVNSNANKKHGYHTTEPQFEGLEVDTERTYRKAMNQQTR